MPEIICSDRPVRAHSDASGPCSNALDPSGSRPTVVVWRVKVDWSDPHADLLVAGALARLPLVDVDLIEGDDAVARARDAVAVVWAHRSSWGLDMVLEFDPTVVTLDDVGERLRPVVGEIATRKAGAVSMSVASGLREEDRPAAQETPPAASSSQYWAEVLAGVEPLQMDSDLPHEPPGAAATGPVWADLPSGIESGVADLAAKHRVPEWAVYAAAHLLTLRSLCGQGPQVTTTIRTRWPAGARGNDRDVVGLVPLRVDTAQDTWLDLVHAIVATHRAGDPHEAVWITRTAEGATPGVPVLTSFDHRGLDAVLPPPTAGLEDVDVFEPTTTATTVRTMTAPTHRRLEVRVDLDPALYTLGQAELVASTFCAFLSALVAQPRHQPSAGTLAPEPRLVGPAQHPPAHVVDRIRDQARRRSEDPALRSQDGQEWTYAEMIAVADQVSARLLDLGARSGTCVALAMDRSPELIVVLIGILQTGAACVPLDVTYPPDRIALMMEAAGPLGAVLDGPYRPLLPDEAASWTLHELLAAPAAGSPALPEISSEDNILILFTSGSTGVPKGVEMPHRLFAYYVAWQVEAASGAAGATTLQFAPISFDVSFMEIFSTLCGGGCLQMMVAELRSNPAGLARLIDGCDVARVFLPYVALQQVAEAADSLGLAVRALQVIISSGEQLRVTREIRRLCRKNPAMVLENQFGPTETQLVSTFTMAGDPDVFPLLPPIGTPMDHLEVLVLDDDMAPVADGVPGVVFVGGIGVPHGYRGQPELTNQVLVPHPWRPGDRLFRMGDLVRRKRDGNLVYIGRADSQTKVRGFRVEPAEIELAILDAGGGAETIKEVAVVVQRSRSGDAYLAAFLVGNPEAMTTSDLRAALRTSLPHFMVPSTITWVDSFPRTPSGKRDDRALRELRPVVREQTDDTPPRNRLESALEAFLCDTLDLASLGMYENLFDIGATSLTLMRLSVFVEEGESALLSASDFIGAPSIAALAERIARGRTEEASPLVRVTGDGSGPTTVVVHPLGGQVAQYARLGRHLPAEHTLYALGADDRSVTPTGSASLSHTVEELAERYTSALRDIVTSEPLTIAGWSFGGFVAFEMARLLQAKTSTVVRVVLIDSFWPSPTSASRVDDNRLLAWYAHELLRDSDDAAATGRPEDLEPAEGLRTLSERAVEAGLVPDAGAEEIIRRGFEVSRANWHAMVAYEPEPIDVGLLYLEATEALPGALRELHVDHGHADIEPAVQRWRKLTTVGLERRLVPGDHLTLMDEPHVQQVAKQLRGRREAPRVPSASNEGAVEDSTGLG